MESNFEYSVTIDNNMTTRNCQTWEEPVLAKMNNISISQRGMTCEEAISYIKKYAGKYCEIGINFKHNVFNGFTGNAAFNDKGQAITAIRRIENNIFDF